MKIVKPPSIGHDLVKWSLTVVLLVSLLLLVCGTASAFELETGNDDLTIRWDNTFRYNLASRIKQQSSELINSPNNDDGDRNFPPGLVSSRFDLLTELDTVYKNRYGVRLSAAGWYDPIFMAGTSNDGPLAMSNHVSNDQQAHGQNNYNKRRFGLDAELLDAFAFAKLEFGDIPVNVRVGRHTIYWGESLFPYAGFNGISYGQSPLDLPKALSTPGVELKEIFRPLNQISVQIQPTKELSIAGQYYLQWEPTIFPEGGSYLGPYDPFMNGGERVILPWGLGPNAGPIEPRQVGDWGIAVRYSPEAINGTIGLYYRNFSDKLGQVVASTFAPPAPGAPAVLPTNYHFSYGTDIDLYGISFAKQIFGISVGSELSFRHNMPLASTTLAPAGARGDTMHAVLNFLSVLPKTPVFDTGTAILEFTYGRWNRLTSDPFVPLTGTTTFNGRPGYAGQDRVTRDNSTVALLFTPEWKQVIPSIDMSMPISFATGIHGNSAVVGGGAAGNGSYSVGLSAEVFSKYIVSLTYASFFGTVEVPEGGGQIPFPGLAGVGGGTPTAGAGDLYGTLRDRDLLSLTLKATF